jgi:beta-galactosidase
MSLNRDWLYCPRDKASFARPRCSERDFTVVHLPHSNVELPVNYFSERRTQIVSWYRRRFATPALEQGARVFVDFDGVMMVARTFVNGKLAQTHRGGYMGFSVDVTDFLKPGQGSENVLAVQVDSRLHPDIPPCGKVMDYQTFGGIYRDVRLRVVPSCHLDDLFVTTPAPLARRKTVHAAVRVRQAPGAAEWHGAARLDLLRLDGRLLAVGPTADCRVPAGGEVTLELSLKGLDGIELWELDAPHLYRVRVTLLNGSRIQDRLETRIGFREAVFLKEGPFVLNGRPVKLLGLNRHQTYPYIGAAAPARLQHRDAEVLKLELGCNIVRTSHYPQSPHFLDRCDEIGLLVFEEAPGWGHIGDAGWKELFIRDVAEMVVRDRNHPSIILWGVRVNESMDDHDLYTRTNDLSRSLDPSRPTGGVRWGVKSEFLEDVFTANDYGYKPPQTIINEPPATPYLITEYGSLIDSRESGPNEHLVRQAMTHAEVVNAAQGHPKIAGAVGWCAFDYHSQDWITIDGIQPWGVADIFRHPKIAAAFYASQADPAVRPVLRAATRWKVGDQAGFDPNENTMKQGHDAPLVVFSNCDHIDCYIGGKFRGRFTPAHDRFPHLAHPPFLCLGLGTLWGPSWQELRLVGFVGKRRVAEQRFPASNEAPNLVLEVDDRTLTADGADMTRLLLRHTDAGGNPQPFSRVVVVLEVTGPARLVGPNPCALVGGVTGLYLRAGTTAGLVTITATAPELGQTRRAVVRIQSPRS